MKQKRWITPAALALALTGLAGCGRGGGSGQAAAGGGEGGGKPGGAAGAQPAANAGTPVRIGTVVEKTVERTIPVTGSVAALQTIDLAPKVTARVTRVAGREGAPVRAGQIVVQQDTSDFVTQVEQAQANVQSARARLAQIETQSRVQNSSTVGEVENTRQQLQQAEAALALAKRPQRTQEVAIAENAVQQAQARLEDIGVARNAVQQAQANYERASADRQRYEELVRAGASAQSVLDTYVTQEKVSRAALDSARQQLVAQEKTSRAALNTARQQLSIARQGGRTENIQTAQANVVRARLALSQARTSLQQIQARRSDVQAARAAVAQAEAALAAARLQVQNASVRSPINGVISARLTEPGQLAAPGAPVVRLVSLKSVFFEAQVPETDISSVRAGLNAPVRVDAYPGRVFSGRVARVYPTASTQSRNFVVRVVLNNSGGLLRPGMFARGQVVAERRRGTVVPKDAIVSREGKTYVYVATDNDTAEQRNVRVGVQTAQTAEVRGGSVRPGERVIVTGQEALQDGGKIRVQADSNGGTSSATQEASAQ